MESNPDPRVSVLLPVHNGAQFLSVAIDSILKQSFTDFELIILDDCSSDSSGEIALSYLDPRVKYCKFHVKQGISRALNHGVSIARGRYIARMDSDDISHPLRLELQFNFMEKNPQIGVLGSWIRLFGDRIRGRVCEYPATDHEIRAVMLFENPFAHPATMIRTQCFTKALYSEELPFVEDWLLWVKLQKFTQFANLKKTLLSYRVHPNSSSIYNTTKQAESKNILMKMQFSALGLNVEPKALDQSFNRGELINVSRLLKSVILKNNERLIYRPSTLDNIIENYWFKLCLRAADPQAKIISLFWSKPLTAKNFPLRLIATFKFILFSSARLAYRKMKLIKGGI